MNEDDKVDQREVTKNLHAFCRQFDVEFVN